jgi:predicted dehydrogenase
VTPCKRAVAPVKPTDAANFRSDVNVDGFINSGDTTIVVRYSASAFFFGNATPILKRRSESMGKMKTSKKRVRYAVVGLGHIAQVAVLPAFAHAENSELGALVSGDPEKEQKLSRKYGVPAFRYDDFERAVEEEEIHAVYIALPNAQHREFTERAARAGMHVLCEKPMATTEKDCRTMIAACEKGAVQLMIAYRLHFTPAHLEAIKLARSGRLGELRYFSSIFGMQVKEDNIRTSAADGGGPLFDLGVYCINAVRYLFGEEPVEVRAATAAKCGDKRFSEVEEMATAVLAFPGERLAQFTCSFNSGDVGSLELVGTKGRLRIEPAYEYVGELKWQLSIGDKEQEKTFPKGDQFTPELIHFSDCVLKGKKPEPDGNEGMADVRIIEAIFKSAKSGRAVSIAPLEPQKPPKPSQAMKRPPVKKPKLVKAEAPHPE